MLPGLVNLVQKKNSELIKRRSNKKDEFETLKKTKKLDRRKKMQERMGWMSAKKTKDASANGGGKRAHG